VFVLVAASIVPLLLPYRASSEPGLFGAPDADFEGITIECGNFFGGISGGPTRPEIVEGLEELEPLSPEQGLDELIEAADACTAGGLLRVSVSGALLILALVLALLARRRKTALEEAS
jgi:hypothetical protein